MVKKRYSEHKNDDSSTESNDEARGGSSPGDSCIHVKKAINPAVVFKQLKVSGLKTECAKCLEDKSLATRHEPADGLSDETDPSLYEQDTSLWLCLRCGTQLCGRFQQQHALEHAKVPRSDCHVVAINTTNRNVWCYQCDSDVKPSVSPKLVECIDYVTAAAVKKNTHPPYISDLELKLRTTVESMRAVIGDGLPLPIASGSTHASSSTSVGNNIPSNNTNSLVAGPSTGLPYRDIRLDIARQHFAPSVVDYLPRVRGLSNLGNTCFFNAVLQCLARTPYLLDVLHNARGEKFQLDGGTLKLKDGTETELMEIKGELRDWGNLTQAFVETLTELQSGEGGVFSPSKLLKQLVSRWVQFAGADQHDSHELLRHLLESVRAEDLRRHQTVILLNQGYATKVKPETVEESAKEKIKFYGSQVNDRRLGPEPVFSGSLVSTLTCQDCHHISSRHEHFLDLSLPVIVEKPQPPMRRKVGSPERDCDYSMAAPSSNSKPQGKRRVKKNNRNARKELLGAPGIGAATAIVAEGPAPASGGDGDGIDTEPNGDDDGISDADVEDNLTDDSQPKKPAPGIDQNGNKPSVGPEKRDDTPENPNKEGSGEGNVLCEMALSPDGVASMIEKMSTSGEQREQHEPKRTKSRRQRTYSHADWGNTLAPRYQCEDNECSIKSCLNSFTAVELMTGNNKVCCEACTTRINGKDGKSVNTNATKQFLISSPPAVLILHLKRFQVGPRGMLRKITKEVTFPFNLDIAPFCGSRVKTLPNVKRGQKKLLYSLYGIVEHSGTMLGGHYVAYVKVRPPLAKGDPRWEFLPTNSKRELDHRDEQAKQMEQEIAKEQARKMCASARDSDDALTSSRSSSMQSSSSASSEDEEEGAVGYTPRPETLPDVDPPPGKWYYVSDSHVRETTEEHVLNAQAYLLFYERIF